MPERETLERRSFEFRAVGTSMLEGVVMPYGTEARIGSFREVFAPGAFHPIGSSVTANVLHDRKRPLARIGHGLTLSDSNAELRASLNLPDTTDGRDVTELVRTGVLRGFSVEFRATDEDWSGDLRTINKAVLRGFAVCDDPAYAGATVSEAREAEHRMIASRDAAVRSRRLLWPFR